MKKILLSLFTLIVATGAATAQGKPSLTDLAGIWNMYSIDVPGELYFNVQTDSVFVKTDEGQDSSAVAFTKEMMRGAMKSQLEKANFFLDAGGNMYEGAEADESKKMGKYDPSTGLVTVKEKESNEIKEIQLLLQGNTLKMVTKEKEKTVTILCKKK